MSRREHIESYLNRLRDLLNEVSVDQIEAVINAFEDAYDRDATVFICGNGGSQTTAAHWVCDFSKGTVNDGRRRLRMLSLGDNPALLTAYSNDVGYDAVFSEPLKTYAKSGDVAVLISASGNSPNILAAAHTAKSMDVITVGLIGFGGGKLASIVDHQITVALRDYGPVEDLHLVLDHIISTYMRRHIEIASR